MRLNKITIVKLGSDVKETSIFCQTEQSIEGRREVSITASLFHRNNTS